MKKRLFSLLFLGTICGIVSAQTLKVDDVEVLAGGTASYALKVNVAEGTYTGVQFNISFPQGFSITEDNQIHVTALSSWQGANVLSGQLNSSGAGNVSCFSGQKVAIPTGDVILATIEFTAPATLGEYTVNISDVVFMTEDTRKSADNTSFKITVADHITLYETATSAPRAAENVKVFVKRNFTKDIWSTICYPFAMTEAQTKAAFGDGVVIGDFAGYTITEEGKDIVGVTVKFTPKTAIEANHPYVIKPSKTVEGGFTVEGVVTIDPAAEKDLVVAAVERSRKDWSEMIGTFIASETPIDKNCLFLNGGKFWYSNGNNKMKAFRAYFDFYDVLADVENAGSRVNISFDDITGVRSVKNDSGEDIYTLSGQRVKNAGKGVYIVNGKKVIKK